MSDLKVNKIEPSTASTVVVTPSVEIQNTIGSVVFTVKDNHTYVYSPINVGSEIDNSTGNEYTASGDGGRVSPFRPVAPQHLTSRGSSLSPEWSVGVPYGGIMLWWGLASNIPTGWVLCNGETTIVNGISWTTPDLQNRFVVGAGGTYLVNDIGGSVTDTTSFTVTSGNMPAHTHRLTIAAPDDSGGFPGYGYNSNIQYLGNPHELEQKGRPDGARTGYWNVDTAIQNGSSGTTTPITIVTKTVPPYYALCYIMRVPTG